jgi:hypothetical protein
MGLFSKVFTPSAHDSALLQCGCASRSPKGEARWTGLSSLTINRRSLAPAPGSARVAQLVEHATENRSVGGSIPPPGTSSMLALASETLVE